MVALSCVAVIGPVVLWGVREDDPEANNLLLTKELSYCMEIISNYSDKKFQDEMYKLFIAIESGELA